MQEKERSYFKGLYQAATAVNSSLSTEEVLRAVAENVASTMSAKGCSLMLLTPDSRFLFHTASYGLSDGYVRKGPLSADKSISEALGGKTVAVLDAATDKRVQYREEAAKEGIASILSIPMMHRERVIGVIRVYTADPHEFTQAEVDFVSAVANLGAIALENAKLYESLRRDYDALKHYYFPFL